MSILDVDSGPEPDPPRLLIEHGPVHRKVLRLQAVVAAITIALLGAAVGLLLIGLAAHRTSVDVAESRKQSILMGCYESNERHVQVKHGLEALVIKVDSPHLAIREVEVKHLLLEEFVQAIAPAYHSCTARVTKLTQP